MEVKASNLKRISNVPYLVDLVNHAEPPLFMTLKGKYPTIRIPKAYRGKAHNMGLPSSAYTDAVKYFQRFDIRNAESLFMIGFGDGWYPQALLDMDLPNLKTLYLAIPDFFNFRYAFDMRHLPMLSDKRLNAIVGDESDVMKHYYDLCAVQGVSIVHNPVFEEYCKATGDYKVSMNEIERVNLGGIVHEKEAEMMDKNLKNTFEIYKYGHDVVELFGSAEGKSIFLVGAGPSLNGTADIIRKAMEEERETIIVMCAIQARAKFAEAVGMAPDYWLYSDYHDVAVNHAPLEFIQNNSGTPLICGQEVARHVSGCWNHKNIYWFWDAKMRTQNPLNAKIFIEGELNHAASSMTSALDLAIKMKPDNIFLFGIDCGFVDKKDHADGYDDTNMNWTKENDELYKGWYVEDVYGNQLETTYPMYEDTRWMNQRLVCDDVTMPVFNCGRGAKFDNTVSMAVTSETSPDTSPQEPSSPQ